MKIAKVSPIQVIQSRLVRTCKNSERALRWICMLEGSLSLCFFCVFLWAYLNVTQAFNNKSVAEFSLPLLAEQMPDARRERGQNRAWNKERSALNREKQCRRETSLTPAFQGLPSAIPALCTLCPQGPSRGPHGVARAGRREAGTGRGEAARGRGGEGLNCKELL